MTRTPKENENWDDFMRRINNAQVRLDLHGINHHIPPPQGSVTPVIGYIDSMSVSFTNPRRGVVFITFPVFDTVKRVLFRGRIVGVREWKLSGRNSIAEVL